MSKPYIPITVFTGFLGAGKTSTILSTLPRLPAGYRAVLLKNEYGDVEVDSKLAQQSSLAGVSEILNGCMCCVLVGQMQTAILEIKDKYFPDRIIIECSGSAFPATLAFQIRELERQTAGEIKLDAIVTVVDAENFTGYEDTSPTAKMQSSYTDIILINKWEHVSERQLDVVLDHLHTLNDTTPMLKCPKEGGVDPNLIFGLETKLFSEPGTVSAQDSTHHEEVETVTLLRGAGAQRNCKCHPRDQETHDELDVDSNSSNKKDITADALDAALNRLSKENVWRVKGFIRIEGVVQILNWAFGRYNLTTLEGQEEESEVRLTCMGGRGEVRRSVRPFAQAIEAHLV
ncbi:cobW-domain-containing protein [Cylindrobasidium torrendii FP15055 ss-10]|uniref:CobW-domain-containing protein n=1 Tax=Cylindrobasidium torrendii FP15055 ss-10 TaxID=1314674 RepID=A0A0D7BF67_9AGAR|nr:cobW-domain-containing protein [Cylindrobasidium torrendii FP15055 ss-10]